MTAIVFSKDRALQLDAFLRSYARFVTPRVPVDVIWLPTSSRHARAYLDVFARHPWVRQHRQGLLKQDVLDCLPATGCVAFFVDDLVFVRPWAVLEQPGLSLRLGLHLTRCYTAQAVQAIPPVTITDGIVQWRWADGAGDWGYPLSLDGQLFDAAAIRPMLAAIAFTSPNTLEAGLQRFFGEFRDQWGCCYTESRIVNVPWNRVQDDYDNRFARDPYAVPERMLSFWEQGHQIDLAPLAGVVNVSCHQEFPLALQKRAHDRNY